jgi:hypothetical protein
LRAIDEKAVTDAVQIPGKRSSPPPIAKSPTTSSSESAFPPTTIAAGLAGAFAIGTYLMRGRNKTNEKVSNVSTTKQSSTPISASINPIDDVSIPYNSAALLAYDEWRHQFNKGTFDESKFEKFMANYEAITVKNVVAKKKAREQGASPQLSILSENADQ